jgi:hypothetical protein
MMRLGGVVLACGCVLPATTGAPLPPTTVGQGKLGANVHAEIPVVNLVADTDATSNDHKAVLAAPTLAVGGSFGITDTTDIEAELYFFDVIALTGGSVGLRQTVLSNDSVDVGIAARFGGLSNLTDTDTQPCGAGLDLPPPLAASAWFGSAQAIAQLRAGRVRPLLAFSAEPFRIKRDVLVPPDSRNAVTERYWGFASSVTFALWIVFSRVQFGPYVAATHFSSDTFSGGWMASGGMALTIRRDRRPPPP